MSSSAAPFGLRPVGDAFNRSNGGNNPRYNAAGIADGYTASLYQGTPVKMATTGVIQAVGSTEAFVGAFGAAAYTPSGQAPTISKFWPASTALATSTTANTWYYDDPGMMYEVQANGSLAQSSIGDQANLVNPGSGNTTTGLSSASMSSTLAAAGTQAQLRILGLVLDPDNAWGDSFTKVQVQVAYHQLLNPQVAI